MPDTDPSPLPRVTLKPRRAQPFFGRHPWVFSGAIERVTGDPAPGAEVIVVTDRDQFVARGLYNPASNIRVRLYSWEAEQPLDRAFWLAKLDAAISLREGLFGPFCRNDACRLIFSEADGVSGLIVDRYGEWLLMQFTSRALAEQRGTLVDLLAARLQPAGIWLRTEKGMREAEGLEIADGLLHGREPPRPLAIAEAGVSFDVDVVEGQKTGFFLDQRDNRQAFLRYLRGGRMLDVCCYSGGFSLHAARQGKMREIVAIDVSAAALAVAAGNAARNELSDRIRFQKADAFQTLEAARAAGERFDVVVLDPPKLARHARGIDEALRGYHSLNRMALDILVPGGLLVTCSCTGHVSREMFAAMLADAATSARRGLQLLEMRGPSPDHPVSIHCPESSYLKCFICRVP